MILDGLKNLIATAFRPKLELSKRAVRRLEHTTCRRIVEIHRDGKRRTVTRCRLNMAYLDRSKY